MYMLLFIVLVVYTLLPIIFLSLGTCGFAMGDGVDYCCCLLFLLC